MTDQTTQRMVVQATPERVYATIVDFERYAEWAADLKSVTVHDRDDEGRGTRVTFRAAAFGRSASYTLRYDYSGAPEKIAWQQSAGDITSRIDGTYVLEPTGDGATVVTYDLTVDLRIPIPGFIKRRAEGRIIHTALADLKARAES